MIALNNTIKNDLKSGIQNFEHLVNIDDQIYVATRKQMLSVPRGGGGVLSEVGVGEEDFFFEDAGLRITDLSEKIDLKAKKPQLSNITITLANFPTTIRFKEGRFSDQFQGLMGKIVKIYFKTQSCKSLGECLLVGQFKISRINHDDKQIKLTANDLSIDSLLSDIPKTEHILFKGINTFDHYSSKPIPTLYGHLESAPAQVYKEEVGDTFKIRLLPDTSYLDGSEIGGVSRFDTMGTSSLMGVNDIFTGSIQLIRQNNVQVGIGDHLCDVPCLPYEETRKKIKEHDGVNTRIIHAFPQWFANHDHIRLAVDTDFSTDEIESSSLWLSINEKPIAQESLTYHIRSLTWGGVADGEFEGAYSYAYNENEMLEVSDSFNAFGEPDRAEYKVGVQKFQFKPFSGYTLNEDKDGNGNIRASSDVHFVGSLAIYQYSNMGYIDSHRDTLIHSVYASPVHDDDAVDEDTMIKHIGYPKSLSNKMTGGTNDVNDFDNIWRRTSLMVAGNEDYGTDVEEMKSYRTSFTSSRYNYDAYNGFTSQYHEEAVKKYPTVDASVLSLYYFVNDTAGGVVQGSPDTRVDIKADWRDLELRRVWSNKDIFQKDFFVNARGKLGDVEKDVKSISGHIVVKYGQTSLPNFANDAFGNRELADNLHFTQLYKFLTNSDLKAKVIFGEIYDLMLVYEYADGTRSYIYDINVENLSFHDGTNEYLPNLWQDGSDIFTAGNENISHMAGWVIKFSGKLFGESETNPNGDRQSLRGVRLAYGWKQYSGQNLNAILLSDDIDEEIDAFNNNNGYEFGDSNLLYRVRGLTHVSWDEETPSKKLIEKPHDIIHHLISTDEELDQERIDYTLMNEIGNYRMAFSINEKENKRDIVEKICQQSPVYYRYRGHDKRIVVDMIKAEYKDSDVSGTIDLDSAINFSYNKTKIEDTCMGGVSVNYNYNYSTRKFDKRTPKRDVGVKIDEYKEYYGIDDLGAYSIEIEAPYLQDKASAEQLRNYYFEMNKHQHLECKFTLPISDGIQYEVGDIIRFNKNPNNTKPYGKNINSKYMLIDQRVTPYFFITKIQKSLFRTKIECIQTHELDYKAPPVTLLGDVNLSGQIEVGSGTLEEPSDLDLMIDIFAHGIQGYSEQQLVNADMNGDGVIDQADFVLFINEFVTNE